MKCSDHIEEIIPDGLGSSDSDECKSCIEHVSNNNNANNMTLITITAESEQTTADHKSQFVLVPNFSAAKPQRVIGSLNFFSLMIIWTDLIFILNRQVVLSITEWRKIGRMMH